MHVSIIPYSTYCRITYNLLSEDRLQWRSQAWFSGVQIAEGGQVSDGVQVFAGFGIIDPLIVP